MPTRFGRHSRCGRPDEQLQPLRDGDVWKKRR
jgi:hypothetical protein